MSTWSGAELRTRLAYLGLSIQSFAIYSGRDERSLRRVVNGSIGAVSDGLAEKVRALEAQAEDELARWDEATEEGAPIEIPRLNAGQEEGELPPHWYLALAGRHIEKWGDEAQIEWGENPLMSRFGNDLVTPGRP